MSNSDNGGFLAILMIAGTIGISIYSGVLAWDWVEPESFGGALMFLAAWSLFSYIGYMIVGGIVALLSSAK